MAVTTVKELQKLTAEQSGQRISLGKSMYGTVRADRNGEVSIYVVWRYKFDGKLRQIPIGTWKDKDGFSLKALRDTRDTLAAELKTGVDPIDRRTTNRLKVQADQAEEKAEQVGRLEAIAAKGARLTVRDLFDLWHKLVLVNRKDAGAEAKRAFERDVFPHLGDVAATDVTKAQIQTIVDTMLARGVVRMTKRVFSDLRQMFGFALDRELIEADPTARIKKKNMGKDTERDRVLNEKEISLLMRLLPLSGMATTNQAALLIQLSTLARIGEVVAARWEHVDLDLRVWTLPVTKNGKPHQIWLSDFALRQFKALREITGSTKWVFPNSAINGPLDSKTTTKQVADRQRDGKRITGRSKQTDALKLLGGKWTPHDLRRTGATTMATLGALSDVVERCLNHTEEKKMKRIYQRAAHEGLMRDAWNRLGDRLDLLAQMPENVVTLRAA